MTYNPVIPQSFNIPSQSQSQFLTNFGQLNSVFDIDHVPFNDATVANRGKHDKSTYIEITPDPTTLINEIAVYSKESGSVTRLFMRQENSGTVIKLTGTDPYVTSNANQLETSTFLAGVTNNQILKTGRVNKMAVTSWLLGTVTFLTAFPNNCYSVVLTPMRGTSTPHSMYLNNGSISASGFQLRSDDNNWDFVFYYAIGD